MRGAANSKTICAASWQITRDRCGSPPRSEGLKEMLGIRDWPPAALTALVGLAGIVIGACLTAWLAARRDRRERQVAFIEKQLSEFYSPMLGLRAEIRMFGELRVKLQNEAGAAWRELCEGIKPGPGSQALSMSRFPQFKALIEHDNTQFNERLMPAYRKMVGLFREKLWPAEDETREHYSLLVEFVDVWERWLSGALPPELIARTGHSEAKLHPFYSHLEAEHARLRQTLSHG
jgi:hypothetical protein